MGFLWFKFLCWLGRKTPGSGLPLCRVYNAPRTEHYTLLNDGFVVIQAVNSKAADVVFVQLCSPELLKSFQDEMESKS